MQSVTRTKAQMDGVIDLLKTDRSHTVTETLIVRRARHSAARHRTWASTPRSLTDSARRVGCRNSSRYEFLLRTSSSCISPKPPPSTVQPQKRRAPRGCSRSHILSEHASRTCSTGAHSPSHSVGKQVPFTPDVRSIVAPETDARPQACSCGCRSSFAWRRQDGVRPCANPNKRLCPRLLRPLIPEWPANSTAPSRPSQRRPLSILSAPSCPSRQSAPCTSRDCSLSLAARLRCGKAGQEVHQLPVGRARSPYA